MKFFAWNQPLGLLECPYMKRWVLNLYLFSIRLHHWYASDDSRYWHDHSWDFITIVLKGSYIDVSPKGEDKLTAGSIRYRPASHKHTVVVPPGGCWTLLLTGPEIAKWGFWVNGRFKRSEKYFAKFGHHPCETR